MYRGLNPSFSKPVIPNVTRIQQVLLARLRTGSLNYCYQHEATKCDYCEGDFGDFNMEHYLIECPITSESCQSLRETLSNEEMSLNLTAQGQIMLQNTIKYPAQVINAIISKPFSKAKHQIKPLFIC